MACLQDQLWVDIGFHGGVIPGNADELRTLIDAGVKSFKAFMIDSGVDEFPASDLATLDQAMPMVLGYVVPMGLLGRIWARQQPSRLSYF